MTWLNKLPDSRPCPPGLEWTLLRRMPRILVLGTVFPLIASLLARALAMTGGEHEIAALSLVDIYAISLVLLHWTLVLTLSLSCFIVMIMKGPAYVADAYPLPDAERPGSNCQDPYPSLLQPAGSPGAARARHHR